MTAGVGNYVTDNPSNLGKYVTADTGVGVVAAGTAVAFFMRATKWVRVAAALCLAFSLFNAFYMEKQLSDKRNEISQIFNNSTTFIKRLLSAS